MSSPPDHATLARAKAGDRAARNAIQQRYGILAKASCRHWARGKDRHGGRGIDRAEIAGAAFDAIEIAINKYDPDHPSGASFGTFLFHKARGVITTLARRADYFAYEYNDEVKQDDGTGRHVRPTADRDEWEDDDQSAKFMAVDKHFRDGYKREWDPELHMPLRAKVGVSIRKKQRPLEDGEVAALVAKYLEGGGIISKHQMVLPIANRPWFDGTPRVIALGDFENVDRFDWVPRPIVGLPREPAPAELTQHQIADRDVAARLAQLSEFPKMLKWLSARTAADHGDQEVANIFWLDPAYALAPELRPRSKAEAARLLGLSRGILDRRRAAIIKRFSGMSETDLRARVPGFAPGPRAYEHVDFPREKIAGMLKYGGLSYDEIARRVRRRIVGERRGCEEVERINDFARAPISGKFLEPAALAGRGAVEANVMDGPRAPRVRYVVDAPVPQVARDRSIRMTRFHRSLLAGAPVQFFDRLL